MSMYFIAELAFFTVLIFYFALKAAGSLFPFYRKRWIKRAYWGLNLIIVAGFAVWWRRIDAFWGKGFLIECVVVWTMAMIISLFLFPVYGVFKKIGKRLWPISQPVDEERRKLLRAAAISFPAISLGISSYGVFYGGSTIQSLRHDIFIKDLDPVFHGFKIAQISDSHIGMFFSVEKFERTLKRLAEKKPDVLVITGDLIDDVHLTESVVAALERYYDAFRLGIYFCWGNHEYFRDFARIEQALAKSRICVLRNQGTFLAKANKPLYLLGVDYPWAENGDAQMLEGRKLLDQALAGAPEFSTKILLSHHSALIDQAYESGIDLTLTGHTHGGQFAILGHSLLPVRYKYMRGMYQEGGKYGYVSTGAGSWFPFRLGCPAEIAVFTLKQA